MKLNGTQSPPLTTNSADRDAPDIQILYDSYTGINGGLPTLYFYRFVLDHVVLVKNGARTANV